MVLLSFILAYLLREYLDNVFIISFPNFVLKVFMMGALWIMGLSLARLYSLRIKHRSLEELLGILLGSSVAVALTSCLIFFGKTTAFSRLILVLAWFFSIILLWLGRYFVGVLQNFLYHRGRGVESVILIGEPDQVRRVLEGIRVEGDLDLKVLGVVTSSRSQAMVIDGVPVLGSYRSLERVMKKYHPQQIIQADPKLNPQISDLLLSLCELEGIGLKSVPDISRAQGFQFNLADIAGIPIIEYQISALRPWFVLAKRVMDIVFSLLFLIFLSPLLLLVTIVVKLDSPGTIFFPHRRVGRGGKEFTLYKFRSMRMFEKDGQLVHAIEDGEVEKLKERQKNYKLKYDPRITRVGRFIRRTSIDELPQLWNVLKGEMSLVGPRAYEERELKKQQEIYPHTRELVRRLLVVKPGITGVWQVSGRSNIDFSERVAMDAYYATHTDFFMDIKILLSTIPVVIKGSGAM